MRKITTLALLTAALLTGTTATAQEPTPTPTAAKPAPAATVKKLTDDELMKLVEDLGFEITKRPAETDAVKRVNIKVTRGDMDVPMSINLNGDKSLVMAFVTVGKMGEAELGNAPALLKLLELNDGLLTAGKGKFLVNAKTKVLWMSAVSENRGVTPKVLRDHIEETVAAVCDHRDAWDFTKWAKPGDVKTEAKK